MINTLKSTVDKQSNPINEARMSDLDMGNNRIINVAHPRDPNENSAYERDVVTSKFFFDYIDTADRKFLKVHEDNVLDGKLEMKLHKIMGLADPLNADDAVTKRYISSRFQALNDSLRAISRKITFDGFFLLMLGIHAKYVPWTMTNITRVDAKREFSI